MAPSLGKQKEMGGLCLLCCPMGPKLYLQEGPPRHHHQACYSRGLTHHVAKGRAGIPSRIITMSFITNLNLGCSLYKLYYTEIHK